MKIDLTPPQLVNAQNLALDLKLRLANEAALWRKGHCPRAYRATRQDWVKARDLYRALTNQFEKENPANESHDLPPFL